MANFNGHFCAIQNQSARGGEHAIGSGRGTLGFATLSTSTTAATVQRAAANFVAPANGYIVCVADGPVRVATGETAARGASAVGHYVPADQLYSIAIAQGETISVIDA